MNHQLLWEITLRLDRWQATYREDAARLRLYQRELANIRRLPARPHTSIQLLLRQCAAARRQRDLAGNHAASLRDDCTNLATN